MYTPDKYHQLVNEFLNGMVYDRKPARLYEPVKYELSLGGKRIRPILMMMAYHLYKADVESILPVAIGLETYHNYTLLHDDVMDKAEMRRGKPTIHKVWDENTAILSSEAMVVQAYQGVMQADVSCLKSLLELFSETALQIAEGQQFDMDFEHRLDVTEAEYLEMIRLKTSVLLACALKMGAVQGGASTRDAELLYKIGERFGLAFQLQDDFLDVYGDPKTFGKKVGGDILSNKKTFMLISACQLADGKMAEELTDWLEAKTFDPTEKIAAVTAIYDALGIKDVCTSKISAYFDEAQRYCDQLSVNNEAKAVLWNYIATMMNRTV